MSDVTVVIPWRGGCDHRAAALGWVLERYESRHPGWRYRLAGYSGPTWRKAAAVMPAVAAAPTGIVVVADADCWTGGLEKATAAVAAGAGWAVPHEMVYRLTADATGQVFRGMAPAGLPTTERPYIGTQGGGFVVAPKATLLEVPLDPRFEGWGCEDLAWAYALTAIVGRPWRGTADLFHLWHPPQSYRQTDAGNRRFGRPENHALLRRYRRANRDPSLMRSLLAEVA